MMQSFTILIADDDQDDSYLLATACWDILGAYGSVYTSPTPVETLTRLIAKGIFPDLILLDYDLPPTTALDVLAWMKTQPQLKESRIVVCSATASRMDMQACRQAGASWFFEKPVGFEAIKAEIGTAIRQTRGNWQEFAPGEPVETAEPAHSQEKSPPN